MRESNRFIPDATYAKEVTAWRGRVISDVSDLARLYSDEDASGEYMEISRGLPCAPYAYQGRPTYVVARVERVYPGEDVVSARLDHLFVREADEVRGDEVKLPLWDGTVVNAARYKILETPPELNIADEQAGIFQTPNDGSAIRLARMAQALDMVRGSLYLAPQEVSIDNVDFSEATVTPSAVFMPPDSDAFAVVDPGVQLY